MLNVFNAPLVVVGCDLDQGWYAGSRMPNLTEMDPEYYFALDGNGPLDAMITSGFLHEDENEPSFAPEEARSVAMQQQDYPLAQILDFLDANIAQNPLPKEKKRAALTPEQARRIIEQHQPQSLMQVIDVEEIFRRYRDLYRQVAPRPRGKAVALKHGGLPERFPQYLGKLIALTGKGGPIERQFVVQDGRIRALSEVIQSSTGSIDPLNEEKYVHAKAVVNKYGNRVLFLTTTECAAMCTFCTRGREVGTGEGAATKEEIDQAFEYILSDPKIREIIFSGGDSFVLPEEIFNHIIQWLIKLENSGRIDIVRFGTRFPIHNPNGIPPWIFEGLSKLPFFPNIMIHYNHPWELTTQSIQVLRKLKKIGANLFSQTVLLKGVNDDREVLAALFRKGMQYGLVPYLAYVGDPTEWDEDFRIPFAKVLELVRFFKDDASGIGGGALQVVVDLPGRGKIPIELGYWLDDRTVEDYDGTIFQLDEDERFIELSPEEAAAQGLQSKRRRTSPAQGNGSGVAVFNS